MAKKRDIKEFKHIAVFQTAFLGDVALSLHFIEYLKALNQDAMISIITTPQSACFVKYLNAVSNVLVYDKRGDEKGLAGIRKMAGKIKDAGVDCIIAPHRSLRTSLAVFFSKVSYTISYSKSNMAFLYKQRVKYFSHLHEVDRLSHMLNAFSNLGPEFHIPHKKLAMVYEKSDIDFINEILSDNGISEQEGFIVLAPGSVWETKKWPQRHFESLGSLLVSKGFKVILVGSEADKNDCINIADKTGATSLAGLTSIPQTLILLGMASLLVTNDSAPTHFAGISGCSVVTIFGPTVPEFGFAPRGEKDLSIGLDGLKCRPCAIHGSRSCPVRTHECMENISPEYVFGKCLESLGIKG